MKNKKIAEIEIEVNKEFQEDQRMIVR